MAETLVFLGGVAAVLYLAWYKYQLDREEEEMEKSAPGSGKGSTSELKTGYILLPAPRIWTRKSILDQYGRIYEDPSEIDVEYSPEEAEVVYKSQNGIEVPPDGFKSDIGLLSKSEMERYFHYLQQVRTIFEDTTLGAMQRIGKIANISGYNDIKNRLNEEYDYPHCLFIEPLTVFEGIGYKTARTLFEGGYTTVEQLGEASIKELTAMDGIGKKTARKIIGQ